MEKKVKDRVIAIDGFSGCGKSSTAKAIAHELGCLHIDTGAMYRAVTYFFLQNRVDLDTEKSVLNDLEEIELTFVKDNHQSMTIALNGVKLDGQLRSPLVNSTVSKVARLKEVRQFLVAQQRKIGEHCFVVMDGRDIGTHVFPNARLKIFLVADLKIRAERRKLELEGTENHQSLESIMDNLEERDRLDASRDQSPVYMAKDAIKIDTTNLTFDMQVKTIIDLHQKQLQ